MFGTKALELVKDAQRSRDNIQPMNDEGIRQVLEETNSLYEDNQKDVAIVMNESGPLHAVIQVRHQAILHNKRCLLAYLYSRLTQLRGLRWAFGSILPPDIRTCLSERESQWFSAYSKCVSNYMVSLGGLDLMQHVAPPKDLYIQVRCLVDFGDFMTEDGTTVTLTKDSTHLLRRAQCEKLIRLGILQHITQQD